MAVMGFLYVLGHPKQSEYFTEIYLLGEKNMAYEYPSKIYVGEEGVFNLGIVNHEGRNVTYFGEIWVLKTNSSNPEKDDHMLTEFNKSLEPKSSFIEGDWESQWEKNINFSIMEPGNYQIVVLVFKDKISEESLAEKLNNAQNNEILNLKLNIDVVDWT